MIILLYLYIILTIICLSVTLFAIINKIVDWDINDKIIITFLSFVPFVSLISVWYGVSVIYDWFKNRKYQTIQTHQQEESFKVLDRVDIKDIEKYLRKEKLKKLL